MANNNVAILSIMSKFDEKSAREAAKRADKVYEEALNDIGNVNFDKELIEKFDKAMDHIKSKSLKKVNLSSYTISILDSIMSDKDIAEKSKAIEEFVHKIEMLKKASVGQNENAFNMFSTAQLEAVIKKAEKLEQKQAEIAVQTKKFESEANKAASKTRKVSTIDNNYGNQDYSKVLESLTKSLGIEKEFIAEQKESIDNLAKMLNLYQTMEKSKPEEGTKEAIRYSKDLLTVTQQIIEAKEKVDSFTSKGASTYISNNDKLSNVDKVSEYTIGKSKTDYVKTSLSKLKSEEAKIQSEIFSYIKDTASAKLEKTTAEANKAVEQAGKKVDTFNQKIEDLKSVSGKGTSGDKPIIKNIVDESELKTLEEIEQRLYDISDKDADGKANNKEFKEYIALYKQYETLIQQDSKAIFDDSLREEYELIVSSSKALKKYSEELDKVSAQKKETSIDTASSTADASEKHIEQLKEEQTQIQATSNAEEELNQTRKETENTRISVDTTDAISQIDILQEKLDNLPIEKNIKINITDNDYSDTPLLSDEEGKVVTVFRGVAGAWSGLINNDGIAFFTDKLKLAADYADSLAESGKVFQANLSFKNPLEIDGNGSKWNEIDFNGVIKTTDEIVEMARQLGYDGVIFKNILDGFADTDEDLSNVMVALNQAQIKNAEVVAAVKAGTGEMTSLSQNNDLNASVDESKSKLELEAELMESIAKNARDAAEAKKEFVEANAEVKVSTDASNVGLEEEKKNLEEIANVDVDKTNLSSDMSGTASATSEVEDNISDVKILTDNFGKSLDSVLSKFLELNTLADKNGNIYRLFHNSNEIFNKFDTSRSGSNQGMALGVGNYLALSQSGEYNSEAYGKYQTQWYAIVKKAFDINAGNSITQAEADSIAKKFFGGIEEGFGAYLSSELAGQTASKQIDTLKTAAEKAKTTIGEIFNSIGYDAIKDGAEINVFNSDNIVRASEAVLDISQQPFQNVIELSLKLHECNQEIQDLQKRASTLETYDFSGKTKEEAEKIITDLDNKIQLDKLMGTGWISGYEDKENLTKMAATYQQMYGEALKLESINDKDVQNLVAKQQSSSDELNTVRETLKVKQEEYQVLKQQQEEQKKIVAEITSNYLNGTSSQNPIEDVFQGDTSSTGAEQAIQQQNELQEKLSKTQSQAEQTGQVLDETLSTVDTANISRSFSDEIESISKVQDAVNKLTTAIGTTKIEAINNEVEAMKNAANDEIESIDIVILEVEKLIEVLQKKNELIEKSSTPTTENSKVQDENATKSNLDVESFRQSTKTLTQLLETLKAQENDSITSPIITIAEQLKNINALENVSNIMSSIKIKQNEISGLSSLAGYLTNINTVLKEIEASYASGSFIQDITNLTSQVDGLRRLAEVLKQSKNKIKAVSNATESDVSTEELKKEKKLYTELTDTIREYKTVGTRINRNQALDGDINDAEKLKQKIEQLQKEPILSTEHLENSQRQLANVEKALNTVKRQTEASNAQYVANAISSVQLLYDKLNKEPQTDILTSKLSEMKNQLDIMKKYDGINIISDAELKEVQNAENKVKQLKIEISKLSTNEAGAKQQTVEKLIRNITQYLDANTKMSKKARIELKAYVEELQTLGINAELDKIGSGWIKIANNERLANREGKSLISIFKDKAIYNNISSIVSMFFSWYQVINVIREAISTVTELDTALTEMRKVSTESVSSLKKYQDQTFNTANTVGTTALDLQEATASWMRLGESLSDAAESAKDTTILLNVSEFESIDDATESLVAMSQAYTELSKMDIINKLNQVGNNYSISTDEAASALQKSASALKTANNNMDEALALVTAGELSIAWIYRNICRRIYLTAGTSLELYTTI